MIDLGSPAIDVSGAGLAGAAGADALMARLRLLALQLSEGTDWSRCDDHQVVALLEGWGVQVGGPPAVAVLYRITALAVAAAPAAASAAPRSTGAQAGGPGRQGSAGPASTATPAGVPEHDVATLAASLRAASEQGVPFVEECVKEAEAP